MAYILKLKKISKSYGGVRALSDLTVSFQKGTITALVGPNGSGKTTIANILSGLAVFEKGEIEKDGVSRRSIDPADAPDMGIARTFQNIRIFEQMSVMDNILVILTRRTVWEALFMRHGEAEEREARAILAEVGLMGKKNDLAGSLSYGQRKLLEIGRVLAFDRAPSFKRMDVAIFDEVFAGLFPEMIKKIAHIIQTLRDEGVAVIMIEHNMDLVREIADRCIVLDSGALLAEGTPDRVLSEKKVLEAYLGV